MYEDIEMGIQQRLQDKMEAVRAAFKAKNQATLVLPSVYVSTEAGSFTSRGQKSYKQFIDVYVEFEFKNLKSEEDRRKGAYPILLGLLKTLTLQNFGLKIGLLEPVKWQHTTDEEDLKASIKRYVIQFKTYFYIEMVDDTEAEDLLCMGLSYYLDEARIAAGDVVTLREA